MTPNMDAVRQVIEAGADIVAIDGTQRMIDGEAAFEIIPKIKKAYPNVLIFADVRDDDDAVAALEKGADIVAPTFYRFSPNAKSSDLPDWEMFSRMCDRCKGKGAVFMEGKLWTPDDCIRALHYGAHAVVVGTVLTRSHITTQRFVDHIKGFKEKRSLFY